MGLVGPPGALVDPGGLAPGLPEYSAEGKRMNNPTTTTKEKAPEFWRKHPFLWSVGFASLGWLGLLIFGVGKITPELTMRYLRNPPGGWVIMYLYGVLAAAVGYSLIKLPSVIFAFVRIISGGSGERKE